MARKPAPRLHDMAHSIIDLSRAGLFLRAKGTLIDADLLFLISEISVLLRPDEVWGK